MHPGPTLRTTMCVSMYVIKSLQLLTDLGAEPMDDAMYLVEETAGEPCRQCGTSIRSIGGVRRGRRVVVIVLVGLVGWGNNLGLTVGLQRNDS